MRRDSIKPRIVHGGALLDGEAKMIRRYYEHSRNHSDLSSIDIRAILRSIKIYGPMVAEYFITADGQPLSIEAVRDNLRQVLCAANYNDRSSWRIKRWEQNHDNPRLYCSHTGRRIESEAENEARQIEADLEAQRQLDSAITDRPDVYGMLWPLGSPIE